MPYSGFNNMEPVRPPQDVRQLGAISYSHGLGCPA